MGKGETNAGIWYLLISCLFAYGSFLALRWTEFLILQGIPRRFQLFSETTSNNAKWQAVRYIIVQCASNGSSTLI
jgi:hypothetical protein